MEICSNWLASRRVRALLITVDFPMPGGPIKRTFKPFSTRILVRKSYRNVSRVGIIERYVAYNIKIKECTVFLQQCDQMTLILFFLTITWPGQVRSRCSSQICYTVHQICIHLIDLSSSIVQTCCFH